MKLAKFQLTTMMFVPQLSQGIEAWNTKLERQCPSTRTEILLDLWQAYYQVFHWRKIIYNKKCIVSYCLLWFGHLVGKQKCLRLQRIHSVELACRFFTVHYFSERFPRLSTLPLQAARLVSNVLREWGPRVNRRLTSYHCYQTSDNRHYTSDNSYIRDVR